VNLRGNFSEYSLEVSTQDRVDGVECDNQQIFFCKCGFNYFIGANKFLGALNYAALIKKKSFFLT
jgi:hypothetical protein